MPPPLLLLLLPYSVSISSAVSPTFLHLCLFIPVLLSGSLPPPPRRTPQRCPFSLQFGPFPHSLFQLRTLLCWWWCPREGAGRWHRAQIQYSSLPARLYLSSLLSVSIFVENPPYTFSLVLCAIVTAVCLLLPSRHVGPPPPLRHQQYLGPRCPTIDIMHFYLSFLHNRQGGSPAEAYVGLSPPIPITSP